MTATAHRGRALVVAPRVPEYDRDSGSQDLDFLVDDLLAADWHVTFLGQHPPEHPRYAQRLRARGVTVHQGFDLAEAVVADGAFDLVVAAYWEPASQILPLVRWHSPGTAVVVDSMDLHFVRTARRVLGGGGRLGSDDGRDFAEELNAYGAADGVITVSDDEARLLGELIGADRVHVLPLADASEPSPVPRHRRRGLLFVGNYRHLPNIEAVDVLLGEILPLLPEHLRARHRLTLLGNHFDQRIGSISVDHVDPVGWVPSVTPYLHRARVSVIPLRHGAGVKRKVLESIRSGTPVVTTPIGAEGLDLVPGEHALIADSPAELAAAVEALLTDDDLWSHVAEAGRHHLVERHSRSTNRRTLLGIVDTVLARGTGAASDAGAAEVISAPVDETGTATTETETPAIDRLSVEEVAGLRVDAASAETGRIVVVGRHDGGGPPRRLVEALGSRQGTRVDQHWVGPGEEPDTTVERGTGWVVEVDASARVDEDFLDRALALLDELDGAVGLAESGIGLAQPACAVEPAGVAPLVLPLGGSVARLVPGPVPSPVRLRRTGAPVGGPVLLLDEVTVGLADPAGCHHRVVDDRVLGLVTREPDGRPVVAWSPADGPLPELSVVISTYDRPELLGRCLDGFIDQTVDPDRFEIVVIDDGSPTPDAAEVVSRHAGGPSITFARLGHAGRSAAKNAGIMLARAPLVLLFDDDDRPAPDLVAEHLAAHADEPDETVAVLGRTEWSPDLTVTPIMHYVTDVGMNLFAYPNLSDGQRLDWRGFWEGRISCKRSLLVTHALHDERLDYSIDVEMARRLAPLGLEVVYRSSATSWMERAMTFDDVVERTRAKSRARVALAALHPDDAELRHYVQLDGLDERRARVAGLVPAALAEVAELESGLGDVGEADPDVLRSLWFAYRCVLGSVADEALAAALAEHPDLPVTLTGPSAARPADSAPVSVSVPRARVPLLDDPELSVVIPVWSRTADLADMTLRAYERLVDVARLRTEFIVVDNASPHVRRFPGARVVRNDPNQGVARAWNQGIRLARAPLIAVLNNDCFVEAGWDEALALAARSGRRIAFPYTDHGDGEGHRVPDQAGTAGWCFMLSRSVYDELGPFDEAFTPAFCEDTDYWHRAWEAGIELSPVPAARVWHERRTTTGTDPRVEQLLFAHRHKYGWKHGVEAMAAPPYYRREIVDYHPAPPVRLDEDRL